MRKALFPILLAAVLTLTSCDALRMIARQPAAIRNYFFPEDAPTADSREDETTVYYHDETFPDTEIPLDIPETEPETAALTDEVVAGLSEIGGDLEFYTFDEGNAVFVYSEKGAWVIDHIENKAVSIYDFDELLSVCDTLGRAGSYFYEPKLSVTFEEHQTELMITFSVTSETEGAEIVGYGFYTHHPIKGLVRGFRGYFPSLAVFPGSSDPATIYDIADYEALGLTSDYYVYRAAAALATGDIDTLSELLYLDPYVVDAWRSVKIGEYSITRTDFSAHWYPELYVYLEIIESGLEKLPAGKYKVRVSEGYSSSDFDFERLDGKDMYTDYAITDVNTPLGFVYTFSTCFGGGYHPDDMIAENESYSHSLLDFFTVISAEKGGLGSYEEFGEFLLTRFGIDDAEKICSYKDFYNHGGHGLSTARCKISGYVTASGVHVITVDFFADPMQTVVAYTHEYTLTENNGDFTLDSVVRTFDSGIRASGWSV